MNHRTDSSETFRKSLDEHPKLSFEINLIHGGHHSLSMLEKHKNGFIYLSFTDIEIQFSMVVVESASQHILSALIDYRTQDIC